MVFKFTKLLIPEFAIRALNFGCILMVLICLSMIPNVSEAIVINLVDIDSGLPSPTEIRGHHTNFKLKSIFV
jgi:hypothetical protein